MYFLIPNIRNLLSQYNDTSNRNDRETIKTVLENEVEAIKPNIKLEITKDSIRLDSIAQVLISQQCVEQIVQDWTTSNEQMLAWLKGKPLSASDSTQLANIAIQCSDDYGDGVHVARAILGQYNNTYYDSYDDCNTTTPGTTEPRASNVKYDEKTFSISPNPSNGTMSIDFKSEQSGAINVYAMDGRLLLTKSYGKSKAMVITIEDYSGLVLINVKHDGQLPLVKKALILE